MNFDTRSKKVTKVEDLNQMVAVFTKEEVEEILVYHLAERGYASGDVTFKISWRWGQGNDIVVTELEGAEVEVRR